MPLVVVDIQQTARDRWVAEFEAGGVVARRKLLNAGSFDEIILKVIEAHALLVPPDGPPQLSGPDRPIDESLLPPKPQPPLGRRAAQQARVALEEQTKQEWARRAHAYRDERGLTLIAEMGMDPPTVNSMAMEEVYAEVKTRKWTPERKRAAHEKRMARAAARQARAAESGTDAS